MDEDQKTGSQEKPYYPYLAFRELSLVILLFVAVAFVLATFFPAGLEDPADPADSLYVPKTAWYFLWLYELLKHFSGAFAGPVGIMIPPTIFLTLLFLPLLDRSPAKAPRQRLLAMALMGVAVLSFMVLSIIGLLH